jgi:nitronate monooxygenase
LRGVPWPREYSFRILQNKLTEEWADREEESFRAYGKLSAEYAQARAQNDIDTVAVICGEAVGILRDRPPAAAVVQAMVSQAADLLRNGGKLKFT